MDLWGSARGFCLGKGPVDPRLALPLHFLLPGLLKATALNPQRSAPWWVGVGSRFVEVELGFGVGTVLSFLLSFGRKETGNGDKPTT
jgi:hypothetical protein